MVSTCSKMWRQAKKGSIVVLKNANICMSNPNGHIGLWRMVSHILAVTNAQRMFPPATFR